MALSMLVLLPASVQAIIIDPVAAFTNMTFYSNGGDVRGPITRTINGSGLSDPTIVETGDSVPLTWPTIGINITTHFLGFGTTGRLVYDLGDVYEVSALHIWNNQETAGEHIEGNARGLRNTNIFYSTSTIDVNTGGGTSAGSYEMPKATGTSTYEGGTVTFSSPFIGRYILLDVQDNWGGEGFMGLNEIRFIGEAVPEPGAPFLMGGSLIALVILRRRR